MKLYVITGPDGSIKKDLLKTLEDELKIQRISIREELKSKDCRKYIDAFKNAILLKDFERIDYVIEFFNLVLDKYKHLDEAIIGEYWYKYFATEVAYGAKEDLILKLKNDLIKPEVVFYLDKDRPKGFDDKQAIGNLSHEKMPLKSIIEAEQELNFHLRTYRNWDFILSQLDCVYKLESGYPLEVKHNTIQEVIKIKRTHNNPAKREPLGISI